MARKRSPTLTEGELRIMQVLWDNEKATVAEVTEALKEEADLAYTTVLTLMQILERKGYLSHEKAGRAYVYRALVGKQEASREAVRHVVRRFFNDSPELLVLNLLANEKISSRELKRLKKMIDESS
jgi:BlaI family transcriptional regulator, penicillinase repressor